VPNYVVLYRFTSDGAKNIRDTIKRAGAIRQQNAAAGFKIHQVFWLQGPYDMVAIVEAPNEETMMGAMLNVVAAGNVTSLTMRAYDATEMSRILATVPSLPAAESMPKRAAKATPATPRNGGKARASRGGARAVARTRNR
jgi:uncharacterized protein with GYD domain